MRRIGFYVLLPFIYLISLSPFWLLYGISDLCFLLLYYLIRYRRKIVFNNLKNSFPEKTGPELEFIQKRFYRYLCDLSLETFKTLTMSKKKALRHCHLTQESADLFNSYFNQKKSVIIVLGHLGNWEWGGNAFSLQCKHQLYVIYHPLTNPFFNNLTNSMRTRFGTKLIAMKDTFRQMTKNKSECSATAFIADQTASPENAHWMNFLNQDTAVFKGTELMAARFNYPVIFVNIERTERGHYLVKAENRIETPANHPSGYISDWHTHMLEKEIRRNPEIWLWSHRRWKHKKVS
jgi:KDO2-lipid IV(A) lauroyltransferase